MKWNVSIKSKMLTAFITVTVSLIIVLGFTFGFKMSAELEKSYNKNAVDQLTSIHNNIITQHQSILFYKERVLANRKLEIKANVDIIIASVNLCYKDYLSGRIIEEVAKKKAIDIVKSARFNNNVGYFWINDNGRPFPTMIMHPTIPNLDGSILDSPDFNWALGRNENLFKAFVDVTEFENEGYVDYLWPKPIDEGLTEIQPKISYVKIFRPWNWIIGTGVYIDDIEKEGEIRVKRVIEELNDTMVKLKVGEHGYFFVFNSKSDMLVHPNLSGLNIKNYFNPVTGKPITQELIELYNSGGDFLNYYWDRPGNEKEYNYRKRSFVKYYEPLDWYIASSVYYDDQMKEVYITVRFIVYVSIIALIFVLVLSFIISSGLTKSLKNLMGFIENRDTFGIPKVKIPYINGREFNDLRLVVNSMIDAVKNSKELLESHKEHLEELVLQRTQELEDSIRKLKSAQKQLIESEKIASLGGIVAGVAHEINTPLGIGVTAASFLETKTEDFSQLYINGSLTKKLFEDYINTCIESSQIILNSLVKAADLVKSFKQIAVDTNIEDKREINLKDYIQEIIKSIQTQLKRSSCEVILNIEPLININSYPTAISIIIINLINNSITHGFKNKKDVHKIEVGGFISNNKVNIIYSDNGSGIDDIKNIFNPFYTTNRAGGGKGLGLNIIYNLISQKLKGHITASNREDGGAKFNIIFPID